ncbi:MAG: hypothetical protein JXR77_12010 [Lentisphaeria bacterium]|nr:hypothetical protein [Lentisphaeria bacterium]
MTKPWNSLTNRITLYVLLFLLAHTAVIRALTWHPDCDISYDAPYHVTMGDLFGSLAWRRTFPPTRQSIWATHFADKEIGFHLLLCSLRRWAGLLGYTGAAPPFVLETALLVIGLAVAFWAALRTLHVRQPFLFLPLLLVSCPFFTLRINMVRPHVVSIILMVLTAASLAENANLKRKVWRTAFFGLLFAYFHSNPHFILIPAGCYALVAARHSGWRAFLPAAAGVAGVAVGLTLHPQFPNTFLIWKIQCFDVIRQTLFNTVPELSTPLEFKPPLLLHWRHNAALPILALTVAAALAARQRKREHLPRSLVFLALQSLVCCLGYILSKRMIEYAWPYTVLAVADVYRLSAGQRPLRFHLKLLALPLVLGLALTPVHMAYFRNAGIPIARQFAEWIRERLPPGTYIANVRWDDFPHLFFAAPEYVYSYGLDPMFAYAANPERYSRIERICGRREPFPPTAELRKLLGSRFAYISIRHPKLARRFAEQGIALPYQGIDGWCFDLDAPPVDHHLGRPPQPPPQKTTGDTQDH